MIEGERLTGGYEGRLLAVLSLATTTGMAGRFVLSPLLPAIIDDLGISSSQAGFALTVLAALFALAQYPSGRLADQLSHKTVLIASFGISVAGFLLLAVSNSFLALLASVAVVGVGVGIYPTAAFALLSKLFDERRGQVFGINSAAINLGGVVAAGLAVAVLERGSWRVALVPVVAVLLVLATLLHRWNREPYVVTAVDLDASGVASRIAKDARLRLVFVAYAVFSFTFQGVSNFLPVFLQAEKSFTPVFASNGFAVMFVVAMLWNPLAGRLGDRLGYLSVVTGGTVVSSVGLLILVTGESAVSMLTGIVLFGAGYASFFPVMNAYVMNIMSAANRGGDFGAMRTVYFGIGSLGPAYVGVAAERATYGVALAGLIPCLLVGAGGILWIMYRK